MSFFQSGRNAPNLSFWCLETLLGHYPHDVNGHLLHAQPSVRGRSRDWVMNHAMAARSTDRAYLS